MFVESRPSSRSAPEERHKVRTLSNDPQVIPLLTEREVLFRHLLYKHSAPNGARVDDVVFRRGVGRRTPCGGNRLELRSRALLHLSSRIHSSR